MTTKKTPARRYTKGMGTAVADRTINRKIRRKLRNPEYQTVNLTRRDDISLDHHVEEYCLSKGLVIENYFLIEENEDEVVVKLVIIEKDDVEHWKDVAKRVALGNSMLRKEDQEEEFEKMHHHLRQASLLMSGRHLQHGDATQPERNIEIFTNCSTSATSFLSFYLLLNGSGVGRSYDDDMMLVDWKYMPTIITTIDQSHADILSGEFSCLDKRMAEHLYSYKKIHQFDVPDSREGWAKAIEKIEVMTHSKKYFEDILLIDFSEVRPKGSPIGGMQNRPASGPAPLINAINNLSKLRDSGMKPWRATMYIDHYLAECVLVGGARRAARMATKHWTDPSIEEFISIKQGGFLWSSNNSVTVDTNFWESLKDTNSVASEIFDKITRCSYFDGTGEPGLINQDKLTQNKTGLEEYADGNYAGSKKYVLEKETLQLTKRLTKQVLKKDLYHVTNPCVTGDTWISTTEGPKQVEELREAPFLAVVNGKSYYSTSFWKTGTKAVFKVKTNRGYEVSATGNHKLLVETERKRKFGKGHNIKQEWVEVKNLTEGDKLVISNSTSLACSEISNPEEFNNGWMVGEIVGDGGHNPSKYSTYLRFWGEHRKELATKAQKLTKLLPFEKHRPVAMCNLRTDNSENYYTVQSKALNQLVEGLISPKVKTILPLLEKKSSDFCRGFLRGFFDAEGTVGGNLEKGVSVRLSQNNLDNLKSVQRMLLRLGIASTIYENRREAGISKLPDSNKELKEYFVKAQHELVISKDNISRFGELIGFFEPNKQNRLKEILSNRKREVYLERFTSKVISVEFIGYEDVYDCTVDEVHRFEANGIVAHNCGEISLMLLGGYCTIADVVPYHAQNDEDAEDAFRTAARALIRVNTMDSLYSKEVLRTNRIGVGITGLHEWIWKRFGYGWKEIIDEEASKPMWLMLSRFKRAVSEEAKNYSAEIGSVTPHTDTTQKPAGCRPADSLTTTTQGILTLDELFENHHMEETWGEYIGDAKVINDDKEVQNIQRTFNNGKSKTTKIKLAYGMVVESTENHPWFVKKRVSPTNKAKTIEHNNWVRTDKLEEGDILDINPGIYSKEGHSKLLPLNSLSIRMRGNNNEIVQPTKMSSDLAWFFGYLWGDGSMSPQKFRLRWTDRNIQNLHKVNNILEEQFGISGNIFREKTKDAHTLEVGNKLLWHWLIKNGVYKYFEGRIDRIPVCVRKSSQEDIIAFIAGLIDSDGAIIHGDKDKTVIFSQADYDFCNHMQHVAASVGLIFGFSRNSVGENWQQYRKEMYLMTMGVPSKKKAVDFLVKHSTKCARWNFPGVIWRNEEDGNARKTLGKIESIESGGVLNTYDIEVENSHWFYAGAIKSHNTTSKLFSLTEGAHLPSMREYLRWVQFRNDDPLVEDYEKKGYPIRKLTSYSGTTIVGFPTQPEICKLGMGDKLVTAAEATPEEQYEYLRLLEKYWITGVKEDGVTPLPETGNQISYTLKYDPKKIDFEEFKKTLREGQSTIRCCSVMPQGDATAYEYQPEEPVTKARYQQISQEIQEDTIKEDIGLEHVDCGGGACPIDFKENKK